MNESHRYAAFYTETRASHGYAGTNTFLLSVSGHCDGRRLQEVCVSMRVLQYYVYDMCAQKTLFATRLL